MPIVSMVMLFVIAIVVLLLLYFVPAVSYTHLTLPTKA